MEWDWDKINQMIDDLTARPIGVRMEVGPGFKERLFQLIPPVVPVDPLGLNGMAGLPIVEKPLMMPGSWRVFDQYGAVIREGAVSVAGDFLPKIILSSPL